MDASPIDPDRVTLREIMPGGWYTTMILRRGDRLRLVNADGAAALLAWNLHDASERLNHADMLKIQWSAELRRGRVLFSDMGRVILSIVEDSSGAHDALMGGSNAVSTLAQYGPGPFRNTRDSFILAALKLGLSRRDIAPCVTFFAPVSVAADGFFTWRDGVRRSGDFVELRAEMDLRIAVFAAPHPLDPAPSYAPGAIAVIRSRGTAPTGNDPCRTAAPEAHSAGACSCESNTVRFGQEVKFQHACRENFCTELSHYGMTKRDIVPNLNFFMNVPIAPNGHLVVDDGISAPGSAVEMVADMDVLCVISNCPQVNNPCNGFQPTPVQVQIFPAGAL